MKYLLKYWRKYWRIFTISVLCVCGEAIGDLFQPKLMSSLIDNGAAKGDLAVVLQTGGMMLCIAGVGAVFALLRNALSSYASQCFGEDLRLDLYTKLQSLPIDEIDRFEGGSLITRMTNDITQMQNFANGMMRIFFKAPILCVGVIIMASTLDLKTMPVIIPIVCAAAVVIYLSIHLSYARFSRVQESLDKLNTTMREYLSGIRLVKAFRRFSQEAARFSSANDSLTDTTVKANTVLVVLSPCISLCVRFGIVAIIFFGSRWVDTGDMEVGQIMAFITYMAQLMTSFNMISNMLNSFVRVGASNRRIAEVMNISTSPPPQTASEIPVADDAPHIVFDNVSFAYRGSTGQTTLSGISFAIGRGQTLGVIGPTGAGKSTLAALLMRFYEPTEGAIYDSGVALPELTEQEWRERVAIVPQTAALFTGTIRENILWGRADATDEDIRAAARAAQADEFIVDVKGGYDTVIGQGGINLSGGQKQRISIARALVRNPELLVLDDCTSALDTITEAKVKAALREYSMTCVLVTQRISTAMTCDRILVLENGRAVGLGVHSELMDGCPQYRDIYLSQIGREAV